MTVDQLIYICETNNIVTEGRSEILRELVNRLDGLSDGAASIEQIPPIETSDTAAPTVPVQGESNAA